MALTETMTLQEINAELLNQQDETNENLEKLIDKFDGFMRQMARDKLDFYEQMQEQQRKDSQPTTAPEQPAEEKKDKPWWASLLGLAAGAGIGALIYDSVRDALDLPSLTNLFMGTFEKIADLLEDAAKSKLLGVTPGVTTFSEENPELAKLATAAATAPLASKLEITSEPKRTARGYKAGDVFETKDTRGRPNRFQVMSDPETGRLFTKKVAKDVPLKGTPVTGPAKPLTVGKALGDVGDKLKPLAQVPGVTTAGKVLKAVPVAGQAAQAFFTYAEFTTVKDKAEAQIRSLPDSKDLTDEQIDMLASDIATRSAAAFFGGSFLDVFKLPADAISFGLQKAGAVSEESAQDFRQFSFGAAGSDINLIETMKGLREDGLLNRLNSLEANRANAALALEQGAPLSGGQTVIIQDNSTNKGGDTVTVAGGGEREPVQSSSRDIQTEGDRQ